MKAREYTNIQNYIDSRENRLLNKTDLLKMVEPQHLQDFEKWKVKDLRNYFGITHKINGKYKNKLITDIPESYIKWLYKLENIYDDLKENIKLHYKNILHSIIKYESPLVLTREVA